METLAAGSHFLSPMRKQAGFSWDESPLILREPPKQVSDVDRWGFPVPARRSDPLSLTRSYYQGARLGSGSLA
jgi:hypothetical protein